MESKLDLLKYKDRTPGHWKLCQGMSRRSCGDMRAVLGRSISDDRGITIFHLPYAGRIKDPSTEADTDAQVMADGPLFIDEIQSLRARVAELEAVVEMIDKDKIELVCEWLDLQDTKKGNTGTEVQDYFLSLLQAALAAKENAK